MDEIDWDILAILIDPNRIVDRVNEPRGFLGLRALIDHFDDVRRIMDGET